MLLIFTARRRRRGGVTLPLFCLVQLALFEMRRWPRRRGRKARHDSTRLSPRLPRIDSMASRAQECAPTPKCRHSSPVLRLLPRIETRNSSTESLHRLGDTPSPPPDGEHAVTPLGQRLCDRARPPADQRSGCINAMSTPSHPRSKTLARHRMDDRGIHWLTKPRSNMHFHTHTHTHRQHDQCVVGEPRLAF